MSFITTIISFFKEEPIKLSEFEQFELTDWYPPDIKPIRAGLYDVKHISDWGERFCVAYWDLQEWCQIADIDKPTTIQDWQWRGIKK